MFRAIYRCNGNTAATTVLVDVEVEAETFAEADAILWFHGFKRTTWKSLKFERLPNSK